MSEPVLEPDGVLTRTAAPEGLADGELVRLLCELEALGRGVDAARVRLAGEVAHRSRRELGPERLAARLGCRTASEVVQRTTGVAGATAGRRIRLGTATRDEVSLTGAPVRARFAALADALTDGTLGLDAAHAILTTLEPTLRTADPRDVARGERELVHAATATWTTRHDGGLRPDRGTADDDAAADAGGGTGGDDAGGGDAGDGTDHDGGDGGQGRGSWACPVHDADDVRLQARVWAEFLDPDGTAPRDRDDERRFLTLHAPRHGLVPVSGLLLPQLAATLRTYADAWTNPKTPPVPDPTTPTSPDGSRSGTPDEGGSGSGGSGPHDRTSGSGSDAGSGVASDTRSRAQVLHDVLATALNVAARAADAPSVAGNAPTLVVIAHEQDLHTPTATAHTGDGTPVSIATARHVGCAGAIQHVTLDHTGRINAVWSPRRCFTGTQRRAIAVRDGGCIIPGCHVPATWCEVHHVTPHAEDPDGTHTDNGVLLCWHHHRTIDTSGWTIRMIDGLPWIRPPGWLDRTGRWRPARPHAERRIHGRRGPMDHDGR